MGQRDIQFGIINVLIGERSFYDKARINEVLNGSILEIWYKRK